ncbi:hypothetical protein SAMD00023353_2800230 [Rosellinia necatrix]|uniref:Uncharacterized protein n=1 Tax=Rosellinia necatrix TaxID=77044 RepID=A0A1S8A8D5_ROSNE|nr:hypothetical protein SAMD00023353_2800230 [Rosellinia necatrix]
MMLAAAIITMPASYQPVLGSCKTVGGLQMGTGQGTLPDVPNDRRHAPAEPCRDNLGPGSQVAVSAVAPGDGGSPSSANEGQRSRPRAGMEGGQGGWLGAQPLRSVSFGRWHFPDDEEQWPMPTTLGFGGCQRGGSGNQWICVGMSALINAQAHRWAFADEHPAQLKIQVAAERPAGLHLLMVLSEAGKGGTRSL